MKMEEFLEMLSVARHLHKRHDSNPELEPYSQGLVDMLAFRFNTPIQHITMLQEIVAGE